MIALMCPFVRDTYDDIYGAVIIAQNYCDSSRGSFDECRLSAGWPLNPQTKPTDLGCEFAARLLPSTSTVAILLLLSQ